jgi:hypothetical protein
MVVFLLVLATPTIGPPETSWPEEESSLEPVFVEVESGEVEG